MKKNAFNRRSKTPMLDSGRFAVITLSCYLVLKDCRSRVFRNHKDPIALAGLRMGGSFDILHHRTQPIAIYRDVNPHSRNPPMPPTSPATAPSLLLWYGPGTEFIHVNNQGRS